ncbi:MAG: DUF4129 domain-containing protein [Eubacterium sp.]|nr:DUF4129 domain-containing protein [Eubacterium sp.]
MKSKLLFARIIFRGIYSFLFLILGSDFLLYFFRQKPFGYKEYTILAIVVILSYIIRIIAEGNLICVAGHIIMAVAAAFPVSSIPGKVVMIINVMIMMLASMRHVKQNGKFGTFTDVPWPVFFIGTIMYWTGSYYKNGEMQMSAYIFPILIIITYLVILYLDGVQEYFGWTKDVSGVPVKRMLSVNSVIVIGIIIISIVAVVLAEVFDLDRLLVKFLKSMVWVLRLIVFGFKTFYEFVAALLGGKSTGDDNSIRPMDMFENAEKEMSKGANVIVVLAMIIIAAVVIYFVIRKIVRTLLTKKNEETDTVTTIEPIKKNEAEKKTSFLARIRERLSAEERFRRLYKNTVISLDKPYVPAESETTKDIEERLLEMSGDDISDITELYDDVRYGGRNVDAALLREMKRRVNRIPK